MGLQKARIHMIEPVKLGTEVMVQWLRALNTLVKDLH